MKKQDKIKEFRSLTEAKLREQIASSKEELMKLRFRKSSGQLQHAAQLRTLRRTIAQIETVLRETAVENAR